MNLMLAILITVALLAANAYFVASEFALMGARRSRIEPLAEQGNSKAKTLIYALENVTLMLATCQLGVTLCSVALGAVSEPAIAAAIEKPLHLLSVPSAFLHPIALVIALTLVVFAHVILGEMVPKNVAVTTPERLALILAPVLVGLSKVFYPVVASLNWLANHITRLFGVHPKNEVASAFTADEVASIVEASEAAGVLDVDTELISGALEFSEHTAGEVMVPLDELVIVPEQISVADFEQIVGRKGYSRFPVEDQQGQLIGYLHIKDVLDVPIALRDKQVRGVKIRPLPKVDVHAEVEGALRSMQKAGAHMARVLDGETQVGVIFLEDILEELVGEVRDQMQR